MLVAHVRKKHRVITGNSEATPLQRTILRENLTSYRIFAKVNIAGDLSPWATTITIAPLTPSSEQLRSPPSTRAMCPIELYAIRAFMSVWRRQISDVHTPPQRQIAIVEDTTPEGNLTKAPTARTP